MSTISSWTYPLAMRVLWALAQFLVVLGALAILVLGLGEIDLSIVTALVLAGLGLVAGVGLALKGYVQRKRVLDVDTACALDPRPPVVYLRQFIPSGPAPHRQLVGSDALEEGLVGVLAQIGPVIALERPGERPPPPGAARCNARDDEWQHIMESWLRKARLVVLVAASPEDVGWELGRCVALLPPERLVLVVPRGLSDGETGCKQYADFRLAAKSYLPRHLPEEVGTSGLIVFGPGFEPRFLPDTTTGVPHVDRFGRWRKFFRINLRPVLRTLAAPVDLLDVRIPAPSRLVLVTLLVIGILAITHGGKI